MKVTELETPAVVVDLDVLEGNLQRLAAYARQHNLKVRPHTKTHKIPAIAHMQREAGCHGITVAKSCEAVVMAEGGLDNILVAYPILGEAKANRLAELARNRRITVAVDSLAAAEGISKAAATAGTLIQLLVEMDVGMRRCGVSSPEEVRSLAAVIKNLPNVAFAGITCYPGHIWSRPEEQSAALGMVSDKIDAALGHLSAAGFECEIVSAGSTPAAFNSHLVRSLTEIRPGTYVFNDRNTMGVGACERSQCALTVMTTVVSTAVPGRAVIDGGTKTFSSDRLLSGTQMGFGEVAEDPTLVFESMSEEHGQLDVSRSDTKLSVGDKLSVVPNHVCACVNMHDRIWYHRNGVVEGSWQVAGRGKVQ
jgi:D-serine deaminase-like pyridoxal phosphate-dependent protein